MHAGESNIRLHRTIVLCAVAALAVILGPALHADEENLKARLERMEQIIQQQQADLEAQRQQLAEQFRLIKQLQAGQGAMGKPASSPAAVGEKQQTDSLTHDEGVAATSDSFVAAGTAARTPSEVSSGRQAATAELERREVEGTAQHSIDSDATLHDASSTTYDPDFPGAWHLPGTTSAMKIGGYVNLAIVQNFDPLLTSDGFIVGSIPPPGVDVPGVRTGTVVTADQTRLNVEAREETTRGTVRAFVEGDFKGDGGTFRLRHAFGQYGALLAGKTWSTFANLDALPEEVDFEGINGAILQRQSQLRFFPKLGQNYHLVFSIEDPSSEIQNGIGSRGNGDIVLSVDRLPLGEFGAWNYKVAAVLRDIRGQYDPDGSFGPGDSAPIRKERGWGVTTSGRKSLSFWGEGDFMQWQLSYGEGIGHYLNDLATIGGGDGVFDPAGKLHALPVFAGFLSYSHNWAGRRWFLKDWPGLLRSNIMISWVDIDNYEFQDGLSYNKTWRASTNLFYYPTQNVQLGAELLWGRRTNKDHSKGSATQLQVSARYSF